MVINEAYLEHITRYIHLNPKNWRTFPYSSLRYYFSVSPEFLAAEKIEALFASHSAYWQFLEEDREEKDHHSQDLPDFY
jgi:hypothetical protein